MPHDATPPNGRMHESGMPAWVVALALAIVLSTALAVLAMTTGLVVVLLPALAIVALGYGGYLLIATRRRRARFDFDAAWKSANRRLRRVPPRPAPLGRVPCFRHGAAAARTKRPH